MKLKCSNCYYNNCCPENTPCQYYSPLNNGLDDSAQEALIERRRQEFYEEWHPYISQYED